MSPLAYMDPQKVMLSEEAAEKLSRAHFKGYFVCEGPRLIKVNDERSTGDDHNNPSKSQNSNNLLMPFAYQRRSSGADYSN